MSAGFRIFLLMLLGFGAIWVYRYRSTQLEEWLYPSVTAEANESRDVLTSPLDAVIPIEPARGWDFGWIRLQPPVPPPEPAEPPWPYYDPESPGALSLQQELEQADLPLQDEMPDPLAESGIEPVALAPADGGGALDIGPVLRQEPTDPGSVPPVPPSPPGYEEIIHTFQEGDSLWKIAERLLGSGVRFQEIIGLNRDVLRGVDPSRIPVGTKLRVRREISRETLKEPPGAADTSVEGSSAPGAGRPEPGFTLHTVKRNESLERIARRYYPGESEGWRAIYEANQQDLPSADWVREGQVLRIPRRPSTSGNRRR